MALLIFILVTGFYVAAIFPLSYFRNDDWLILGNSALVMPKDWHFALRPTLVQGTGPEETWFFRPGFKLGTWAFYQIAELHYTGWLLMTLALFWLASWMAKRIAQRVNGPVAGSLAFAVIALSVDLHFGSLAWAAEGLMNVPQLLLLVGCAAAFLHPTRTAGSSIAAWLCFVGALLFKESSVIFLVWLAAAWWTHPQFQPLTWRRRILPLLPMGVTGAAYLIVRLLAMPIYSGYLPLWEWSAFVRPVVIFVGAGVLAAIPFGLVCFRGWLPRTGTLRARAFPLRWPAVALFTGFFGAWIAPHLGHPFASPGWLLVPGFFFILTLAMYVDFCGAESTLALRMPIALGLTVLLSTVPVLYQARTIQWWRWHEGQHALVDIFRRQDASKIDRVTFFECTFYQRMHVPVWRVIGYEASIQFAWEMLHRRQIHVQFIPCTPKRPVAPRELQLTWDFPHLFETNGHVSPEAP